MIRLLFGSLLEKFPKSLATIELIFTNLIWMVLVCATSKEAREDGKKIQAIN